MDVSEYGQGPRDDRNRQGLTGFRIHVDKADGPHPGIGRRQHIRGPSATDTLSALSGLLSHPPGRKVGWMVRENLNVELEQHHTVLDFVVLSSYCGFQVPGALFAAQGDVIVISRGFRADEAAFRIGVIRPRLAGQAPVLV